MPSTAALPATRTADMTAPIGRRAALPGFLARRLLAIDWLDGVPDAWSLRWVIETCNAELAWSRADWRRLNPAWNGWAHEGDDLSVTHRLPHESLAGVVLSVWLCADSRRINDLIQRLRSQRRAAADRDQSEAYRADWASRIPGTVADLRDAIARRRRAWAAFVPAVAAYRSARALVEREAVAGDLGVRRAA